jgi:hypothetical protein
MELTGENNVANGAELETKQENTVNRIPPSRSDVLNRLWGRSEWLRSRIDGKNTKFTPELKLRVYLIQTECSVYKTILYGMREVELCQLEADIETLKQSIEEIKMKKALPK